MININDILSKTNFNYQTLGVDNIFLGDSFSKVEIGKIDDIYIAGQNGNESILQKYNLLEFSKGYIHAKGGLSLEIDGAKIFVGFLRDLTEIHSEQRRVQELQRELFHVSRVGEMGQIASSLAHEVNQPLAAIANYLQASRQILTTQPQSEMLSAILEKAEAQANRAADIVKRLRAFMDRRDVERRRENVNKLIEEALALGVVGLPSRGTRILLQLAADLPDVTVDRVQIQQVIVNFIRNGVDALESAPRKELTISSMREGNGVRVEVADTGSGIAPGIASTLFKAFATTKAQGMGVGLSICKTIIENHGGHIGFRSRPDGGTIFHFMLPQVDGDSPVGQANG